MPVNVVGVIGAGVMGQGVAQTLAQHGHDVILVDDQKEVLKIAREEIFNHIRLYALLGPGAKVQAPKEVLQHIHFCSDLHELESVSFVIENVPERWERKKAVFEPLDKICPENCIFASNSSCLPITQIASVTLRPDRIIGMHFMNPVPLIKSVEVVRGFYTSSDTIETAMQLLVNIGKEGILIHDSPGFVSSRVMLLMINEAIFLLHEGVSTADDIDKIFKTCYGHKMGPLETADLIGLDTLLDSIQVLYDYFQDTKYRPCPLLKKMVFANKLGRKTGSGFYNYHQDRK